MASIEEYKKQYAAAKAAGDAAGMKAANDGANAIRASRGQAAQVASQDIARAAAQKTTGTAPAGFQGSATAVGVNTGTQQSVKEQMYAAQKAAALAQLKNSYEQNLNAIDRAGVGVSEAYQNARNQTAGASERAARQFAEYAAANGLNNGAGGQAELARNVTLQNNLNDINTGEAQTVADLELQRANAETEYNNAIAQAEAEGNYQLAAALYQEKVRVDEALLAKQVQQYQLDLQGYQAREQTRQNDITNQQWQQQFDYQSAAADREYLYNMGLAMLQSGNMPTADMLAAMGLDSGSAGILAQYYAGLGAGSGSGSSGNSGGSKGGSSSGGSSGSTSGSGKSWADVEEWANRYGTEAAENYIREHYKALGYSGVSAALAGWKNHLLESGESGTDTAELNWSSMLELGLGPVSASFVAELAQYGGIGEDGRGNVYWTNGWNANNYQDKLSAARNGMWPQAGT